MKEKALGKIETKDASAREEIENILEKNDYAICPYIVRIYDFIGIMGRTGGNGDRKQVAVQCLYLGTVHNPQQLCLGEYSGCKKYRELEKHEELLRR